MVFDQACFLSFLFSSISPTSHIYFLADVFHILCNLYSLQDPPARIALETGSRNFKMRSGWRELRNGTALQALHTNYIKVSRKTGQLENTHTNLLLAQKYKCKLYLNQYSQYYQKHTVLPFISVTLPF